MKQNHYERIEVWYALWGDRFFPSRLRVAGKVKIVGANDPGDIGKTGRYRGRPKPYGDCDVQCTLKGGKQIAYLASHLAKHRARLKALHVEDIVFWILWRGTQGNMALTAAELAKLAKMKVPVAMDYLFTEE